MRDHWVQRHDELRALIADANELAPTPLFDEEVMQLLAFLESLTDTSPLSKVAKVTDHVRSGLPVEDS